MNKLALAAAAGLAGLGIAIVAAPASAESIGACQNSFANDGHGDYTDAIAANSAAILAGLRDQGVNAVDVQNWGGCVRADVVRPDGTTAMEFFDPDSLQPLSRNG